VLGAAYMLWMVKKVFYGEEAGAVVEHREGLDLNKREVMTLAPLIILIFVMGLFPNLFLNKTKASIDHFVATKSNYRLTIKGK
jgi:NADH-quinone oxidoreductase subunit M